MKDEGRITNIDPLQGKRLLILGLARQGKALARFAVNVGAQVVVSDLRPATALQAEMAELSDLEIEYVLGEHPMSLLDNTDVVAISGSVPADAPLVAEARRRGLPVTNDSQEFMRRTPTAVIGITGSAGKTTTTALTGVMGQVGGRRTWVGGNIGRPLLADLHKMDADDMVVQELSSFQLEIWEQSPPVAAVLNITPNHLDRHKTMQSYVAAKANILRHQSETAVAVLSADDSGSLALSGMVRGRLRLFSAEQPVADGAFLHNGHIYLRDGEREAVVCTLDDIQLRGDHNVRNVLAAVTLADCVGIDPRAMRQAIRTFHGVEHRLEKVAIINGVTYINDSIATAPERALAALSAFDEPLILLAGGRDKGMVWEEWAEQVAKRVRHTILFGQLAPKLAELLTAVSAPFTQVDTLAEAVDLAAQTAVPGNIVLLSPGGTSYDAYQDFAERGEHFRQLVAGIQ
jgi:UDP-N-acetylmuramoylalanine--D-glutamate ligase